MERLEFSTHSVALVQLLKQQKLRSTIINWIYWKVLRQCSTYLFNHPHKIKTVLKFLGEFPKFGGNIPLKRSLDITLNIRAELGQYFCAHTIQIYWRFNREFEPP